MSDAEKETQAQAAASHAEAGSSLLEQAISATKQTERSRAEELLKTLTEEALAGTVTFSKNLTKSLNEAIAAIDTKVSEQLSVIMHTPEFLKLEGSWRGLQYLVMQSETGSSLKLKVLNLSKNELFKDLDRAVEFDQSQVFKKLYENEFGTAGGEPYGAFVGDYEFTNHPNDIQLIEQMSNVAAACFAPFITSPAPQMFGFESWEELSKPRDLEKIFESKEYVKWRAFRDTDDSRFVTMVMPRTLARLPYGKNTNPIDEFAFEEVEQDPSGVARATNHNEYCWMNAAYVMGAVMTRAFAETSFCTAIRGAEGGGKVEGLPTHLFKSDDGDADIKCPTEVGITDRREAELSKLGFLPLCHYKNTDYAVFFGGQTTQKPKKYDNPDATANAAISARLPAIMATSRFAHYLKVMGRDKIGSFMEAKDCSLWLSNWIKNYINADPGSSQKMRAKYPLHEAQIEVKEIPGSPGSYHAVAHLRPWLQMEELTASLRLVAKIPEKK
ncbi:MAG: type VI secretion system contractile sheath large subunit [Planctomycetota bacterium]